MEKIVLKSVNLINKNCATNLVLNYFIKIKVFVFLFFITIQSIWANNLAQIFNSNPSAQDPRLTIRNEKRDTIESANGAIIDGVEAEKIEIKGLLGINKSKVKNLCCNDVIASFKELIVDVANLTGLVDGTDIQVTKSFSIKGKATLISLKTPYFKMTGCCNLQESEIKTLDITTNRMVLRDCKVGKIELKNFSDKDPRVILQDCDIDSLEFVGRKGEVEKKGTTKIKNLKNASII